MVSVKLFFFLLTSSRGCIIRIFRTESFTFSPCDYVRWRGCFGRVNAGKTGADAGQPGQGNHLLSHHLTKCPSFCPKTISPAPPPHEIIFNPPLGLCPDKFFTLLFSFTLTWLFPCLIYFTPLNFIDQVSSFFLSFTLTLLLILSYLVPQVTFADVKVGGHCFQYIPGTNLPPNVQSDPQLTTERLGGSVPKIIYNRKKISESFLLCTAKFCVWFN